MQEVALSNDLTQLTTEIKTYQSIGGQAIFEIGKRLKKVKEEDLAHGQYLNWLESINMDRTFAKRAIKVSEEYSNGATLPNLGATALYLIATMPEEERDQPQQLDSGEVKKPDEMTVRELREVKRKLKMVQEENADKDAQIERLNNRPEPEPRVVEKTVTKEVTPSDYDELKREASITSDLRQRNSQTQQEMDDIKSQLEKAKADAEFYQKELSAAERIKKNNQKLDDWERDKQRELSVLKVQTAISIYSLIHDIQDFLKKENIVRDVSQAKDLDDESKRDLQEANEGLQRFVDKVNQILDGRKIIEGEFSE